MSKEQVESGRKLLERLATTDLIPLAALWAQRTDQDSQPYLYIVSPFVEVKGAIASYLILGEKRRELDSESNDPFGKIGPFAIKLLGPSDPLAQAVQLWYEQHPDAVPTIYHGPILGRSSTVSLDEAYIYPATMFAAHATPPS